MSENATTTLEEHNRLLQLCQERPEGHTWVNVAPGLDRCTDCGSEIVDLSVENAPTFDFTFSGAATLTVKEIWPDGDAPENPTVADVIARIKSRWSRTGDFIDAWYLDQDVHVKVNGERAL